MKINLILNIGLNTNTGGRLIVEHAHRSLKRAGFQYDERYFAHEYDAKSGERTLVVFCSFDNAHANFRREIERMCAILFQDCIAVYFTELDVGTLIGPRASEWGAFDAEKFIMPDGRTLADHEAQVFPLKS